MLLSVIVPLYSNAPFLKECIYSLYRQGINDSDFEVIIIDDGSTDGGGALADQLASEHVNIQVYHQPNRGIGEARNAGLQKAQGDYIHYVDPDDFVLDHSYHYITETLLSEQPDIICFGYVKDGIPGSACQEGNIVYCGTARDYYSTQYMRVNLPFKWVKRSFIIAHNLTFPSISYSEDTAFTWGALRYAGTLLVSQAKFYSYRTNHKSAVESRTIDHIKHTISDLLFTNLRLSEYAYDYIGCQAVRDNFTHKYRVLFGRILCTPYTNEEIQNLFAQCAQIGTRHVAQNHGIWWINYLYHHPKLYIKAQRLILVIYFGLNPSIGQNGDFLPNRITDEYWKQRITEELSRVVSFVIRVWNRLRR